MEGLQQERFPVARACRTMKNQGVLLEHTRTHTHTPPPPPSLSSNVPASLSAADTIYVAISCVNEKTCVRSENKMMRSAEFGCRKAQRSAKWSSGTEFFRSEGWVAFSSRWSDEFWTTKNKHIPSRRRLRRGTGYTPIIRLQESEYTGRHF